MKQYFIAGTDTEVGKTYVTCHLLKAAARAQKRTVGYKPIAAGCEQINGQWINEDAKQIQQAGSMSLPIDMINPIALVPPIAPHIAAQECGLVLDSEVIVRGLQTLQHEAPELLLMEGAGGWRLPLTDTRFLSDVVVDLKMDVILVVGMKLGCLNHAILSSEAIINDGLNLVGWIANDISGNMPRYKENVATLKKALPAPMLMEIPFSQTPNENALQALVNQLC